MSNLNQVIMWTVLVFVWAGTGSSNLGISHAQEENAAAKSSDFHSALIDVEQLKQILDSDHDDVRLIEASTDLKKYQAGHIPGAIYVHWLDDMISPQRQELFSNPTAEQLAALMGRKGIGESRSNHYL